MIIHRPLKETLHTLDGRVREYFNRDTSTACGGAGCRGGVFPANTSSAVERYIFYSASAKGSLGCRNTKMVLSSSAAGCYRSTHPLNREPVKRAGDNGTYKARSLLPLGNLHDI